MSSRPVLTKFEKAKVIAKRVGFLQLGSPPMIDVQDGMGLMDIAEAELYARKLDFKIQRKLPNGRVELKHLSELYIGENINMFRGLTQKFSITRLDNIE